MARVSVIAMTMNHERFAEAALGAIAAQSFTDFELVITEDASTDSTRTLVKDWLARWDRDATLIAHDERRGISPTLNEALARSSAELVAIVSLDDIWAADRLAAHVAAFDRQDNDVAVVYGDCSLIDDSGQNIGTSYLDGYTPYGAHGHARPPSGDVFESLVRANFIATPGATVRRSAIDEVGGYNETLLYEDWWMWLQLAARHRFAFDDSVAGQYRIHQAGYWSELSQSGAARWNQFAALQEAYGLRADVDPLIVMRLRALSRLMTANLDQGADNAAARLVEIDPPVLLAPATPLPERTRVAADLIANGYSVTRADSTGTVVDPRPSGILYIAPWLTVGGADKATVDWFRYVEGDHFRRYLVTTTPSPGELFADGEALADEAWCLPEMMDRQQMPQFIVDLMASRGVDVVHVMNSKIGYDLIPTLKQAFPEVSVVVQLHSEEPGHAGYPRYVVSRYDNLVDAYSVISQHMKACLEGYHVSPSKIDVIYLGVDAAGEFDPDRATHLDLGLDPERFHVLFPARLVPVKRPAMVLEIASTLRDSLPGVQFHMVGDGELRADLERRAKELDLGDHVNFHGASSEIREWFAACDLALLCSEMEGVPLVLFEAMSMGVPTVAPLVGGIGEILDERSGIAVPADADPRTYARAIGSLASDRPRCERIRSTARQLVLDRYQVTDMGRLHRELYGRLIATATLR